MIVYNNQVQPTKYYYFIKERPLNSHFSNNKLSSRNGNLELLSMVFLIQGICCSTNVGVQPKM